MSIHMNDLDETPFWVEFSPDKKIPKNAIKAGSYNGEMVYIGRAMHNGAMTPGENYIDKKSNLVNIHY